MTISQQKLHSLKIDELKGIKNLERIDFDEKCLTAIMGPNGSGKSTILYALLCCYQHDGSAIKKNWQFREFFTPTSHATWSGSSLEMVYSYRDKEVFHPNLVRKYAKTADRWTPKTDRRPYRNVIFIPIKTCVPQIELETYTSYIKYDTADHPDSDLILKKMSSVFGKKYTKINLHNSGSGKKYSGLVHNGVSYSSLAMGAGEQRVLEILSAVYNAKKHSLVLIDEIDLLLHTSALVNLLEILNERAEEKSLQIIFTTHREVVCGMTDIVSVKHIHNIKEPHKTVVLLNTNPDSMRRLTGQQDKDILIFVEDKFSEAIIKCACSELGMMKYIEVTCFGSDQNCFTIAAGLKLSGLLDDSKHLFVLDGDSYQSQDDRLDAIKKTITGTEEGIKDKWQSCLNTIYSYQPDSSINLSPEVQIHQMICELGVEEGDKDFELYQAFIDFEFSEDTHDYVTQVVDLLGYSREVGYTKVVELASRSDKWSDYIQQVKSWLEARKAVYAGDSAL